MTVAHNSRDRAVRGMFDDVAPRYDLLNRVISLRLDRYWRKKAVAAALPDGTGLALDVGTGTGDLTFAAANYGRGAARVIGLDFSLEMLRLAQSKKQRSPEETQFIQGSALLAPFKPGVFDAVMTAFVLRNVSDLKLLFDECRRVLKPGGLLVTLDMFPPSKNWFSPFYGFYFYRLVPWIGKILSPSGPAYQYLSESVRRFHSPETISGLIEEAWFERVTLTKFLSGAVCMHVARKPSPARSE